MNQKKAQPVGNITVIDAKQRRTANKIAAYAQVLCKDEEGTLWEFTAAAFGFDMKPVNATQEDWRTNDPI